MIGMARPTKCHLHPAITLSAGFLPILAEVNPEKLRKVVTAPFLKIRALLHVLAFLDDFSVIPLLAAIVAQRAHAGVKRNGILAAIDT